MGEWIEIQIGDLAFTTSGGTPNRDVETFFNGDIIWVKTGELGNKYVFDSEEKITQKAIEFSSCKLYPEGTLLIAMYGATIGQMSISEVELASNQACCAVFPNSKYCTDFLYYFLTFYKSKLVEQGVGAAQPNISQKIIRQFKVHLPEKHEQTYIASILNTIDQAIEKTEQLIAKYERIKTGLMQDLLTRGIDEGGNIRSEETHSFKDSALGRIPVEWEVVTVSSQCKEIVVGIVIQPTQYYQTEGFPLLRSFNIKEGKITRENLVFISAKDNDKLSKSKLKEGDVVSVRTGYPGTTAVVEQSFENSNCIDLVISRPKSELSPYFLCCWINSEIGKKQIASQQKGVAQQHFNVGEMKEMLIAKATIYEQKAIVARLSSIELVIEELYGEFGKLNTLKKGLMQDLLTGKVRVDALIKPEKQPMSI